MVTPLRYYLYHQLAFFLRTLDRMMKYFESFWKKNVDKK